MTDSSAPPTPPKPRVWHIDWIVRGSALVVAVAIVVLFTTKWDRWVGNATRENTDDAYVRGDITPLSARVEGYVRDVPVTDFQRVKEGDLLVQIEDADYRARVALAEADALAAEAAIENIKAHKSAQKAQVADAEAAIAGTEADADRTRLEAERQRALLTSTYGTPQRVEQANAEAKRFVATLASKRAELEAQRRQLGVLDTQELELRAAVKAKQASLDLARINLGYTRIAAPVGGVVSERGIRPGQYAHAGSQIISVVPLDSVWVVANFKETQLTHVVVGQQAEIRVDTYPGTVVKARVESLSPASGAQFSLLPPDNATGNFTKVVQRIPVKLVLAADNPLAGKLRPGMSVEATILTDTTPDESHEHGHGRGPGSAPGSAIGAVGRHAGLRPPGLRHPGGDPGRVHLLAEHQAHHLRSGRHPRRPGLRLRRSHVDRHVFRRRPNGRHPCCRLAGDGAQHTARADVDGLRVRAGLGAAAAHDRLQHDHRPATDTRPRRRRLHSGGAGLRAAQPPAALVDVGHRRLRLPLHLLAEHRRLDRGLVLRIRPLAVAVLAERAADRAHAGPGRDRHAAPRGRSCPAGAHRLGRADLCRRGLCADLCGAGPGQSPRLVQLGLVSGLLLAGLFLIAFFFVHEATTPNPLIHLPVLAKPNVWGPALLISLYGFGSTATGFVLPDYLTRIQGLRDIQIGDALNWIALPQIVLVPLAALLVRRIDARYLLVAGFAIIAVGSWMDTRLTHDWASGDFLPSQGVEAVGLAFAITALVTYAISFITPAQAAAIATTIQLARLLGAELGSALIQTFVRVREQTHSNLLGTHVVGGAASTTDTQTLYASVFANRATGLGDAAAQGTGLLAAAVQRESYVLAYIDAFWLIAWVSLAGLLVIVFLRRPPPNPLTPPRVPV